VSWVFLALLKEKQIPSAVSYVDTNEGNLAEVLPLAENFALQQNLLLLGSLSSGKERTWPLFPPADMPAFLKLH